MSTSSSMIDICRRRSDDVLNNLRMRMAGLRDGFDTVIAVGSLGRLELLPTSDLDLVVVVRDELTGTDEAADVLAEVWARAEALNYERPKPGGIFAEPTCRAVLCDPSRRGQIDESPTVFGKRIQLLLEGRCVHGDDAFAGLLDGILGWYGYDEPQPTPFEPWSYLLHDLGRYRHSLAVRYQWLNRGAPEVWRGLLVKSRFSRVLNQAGLFTLLGESTTAEDARTFLRDRLSLTPLERLASIADADLWTGIVTAYDQFLAEVADESRHDDLIELGEGFSADVATLIRRRSERWSSRFRTSLWV